MRRVALLTAVAGLLIASCTDDSQPQAESTSASIGSTVVETTVPSPSTTTSTEAVTTSQATSTTTTTPGPKEFRFWIVPPEGTYFDEQPLPQPIYGYVRPQAQVTVNGLELDVFLVEDPSQPPDTWRWTTAGDRPGVSDPLDVALDEGPNLLVFEASFEDGSTMQLERTLYYDPSLMRLTGYIADASPGSGVVTIELATLEYGEFGIEQIGEDTTLEEFPVEDDALFVVIGGIHPYDDDQFYQGLDLEGIADLAAAAAGGDPLQGYLWRTIYPDGVNRPAAWEFLITPEGHLQQATQFYSP